MKLSGAELFALECFRPYYIPPWKFRPCIVIMWVFYTVILFQDNST